MWYANWFSLLKLFQWSSEVHHRGRSTVSTNPSEELAYYKNAAIYIYLGRSVTIGIPVKLYYPIQPSEVDCWKSADLCYRCGENRHVQRLLLIPNIFTLKLLWQLNQVTDSNGHINKWNWAKSVYQTICLLTRKLSAWEASICIKGTAQGLRTQHYWPASAWLIDGEVRGLDTKVTKWGGQVDPRLCRDRLK